MTLSIKKIEVEGYEEVIEALDVDAGLHAYIAIHNTQLGPALGGTRIYPYASIQEALNDVLRLSRTMTYKAALAGTETGGGKAVIISNGGKSKKLLYAFAEAVNYFKGRFITGEDVGCTTEDMVILRERTPYVLGLNKLGSSGDPSRFAAFGVFSTIKRLCNDKMPLKNCHVAIQGLGNVGMRLATHLFWEGACLTVADADAEKVAFAKREFEARVVDCDSIYDTSCDFFSPCAMGGILNERTIGRLRCRFVVGSANNQLETQEDGYRLYVRKISYAPDFVVNAGGLLNVVSELKAPYSPQAVRDKTAQIGLLVEKIFQLSLQESKPSSFIADQLASQKLL